MSYNTASMTGPPPPAPPSANVPPTSNLPPGGLGGQFQGGPPPSAGQGMPPPPGSGIPPPSGHQGYGPPAVSMTGESIFLTELAPIPNYIAFQVAIFVR